MITIAMMCKAQWKVALQKKNIKHFKGIQFNQITTDYFCPLPVDKMIDVKLRLNFWNQLFNINCLVKITFRHF